MSQLQLLVMLTSQISKFFNQISQICVQEMVYHENKKQSLSENKSKSLSEEEEAVIPQKLEKQKEVPEKNGRKKQRKRRIKKKNPGMPKAPASSYLIFFHQNRKQLEEKYGSNVLPVITKMASKDWSELPPQEKQKYTEKSALEQENYRKLMAQYRKNQPKISQQKVKKVVSKPKKIVIKEKQKKSESSSSMNSDVVSSSSSSSETISKSSQEEKDAKNKKTKQKVKSSQIKPIIQIASSISSSSKDSLGKV